MPIKTLHITFLFLFLTAITGVFMRYSLLAPDQDLIPFSYILHGHSHIAILGWTFLGAFLIFLKLVWTELTSKRQAGWLVTLTFMITICMFIAFLYQGYALFSIIFSTLHIGMEYWIGLFIFRHLKKSRKIPSHVALFIKGAIVSLFISTIGPFALGGLGMAGMKESPFFDMAIYFFLHFQYNGWLYLMLFATFLFILHKKQIELPKGLISKSFWIYIITLLPAYILSILWYGLGWIGELLGIIGVVGQFAGVVMLLTAIYSRKKAIIQNFSRHIRISLLFLIILLLTKVLMEFGLLYGPFASLIFETRAVIVGYLHLTLLGFISIFILTQYQLTGLLHEENRSVLFGLAIFIVGFIVNEGVLFLQGLLDWLGHSMMLGNDILFLASIMLLIGVGLIWSSTWSDNLNKRPE